MIDGWRHADFRECVEEIRSGKSVNSIEEPANSDQIGVLKTSCVYNGRFEPRENKLVIPEEQSLVKCPVTAGTIIVSRMNTADLVGASGYVDRDYPNIFLPDRLWAVFPKQGIDPVWLYYVTSSPEIRARLSDNASGTSASMKNISQDVFLSMPARIPPLQEQCKIAEILRTWDEAIEKASELIELSRAQYSGLRERLIDWHAVPQKRLGSLVEPISRAVPRPNEPYRALSIRSHGKGTFIRMVADPASVDMDTLFVARDGDLIVNITFAWEGAVALVPQEHDGCLVSHRFPTFVPSSPRVDARYLRHALRMPRFTYLLGLVSPGGAGRNRVLNKGDFLNLEVPAPDLGKQEMIAACLDAAEDAIENATEYREALTRQKRGLMQKLLTGEWRVSP